MTSEVAGDSVTLTWQPPEQDGGSPIKAYLLEKADATRKSFVALGEIKVVEDQALELKVDKLKDGEQLLFRVAAVNEVGQGDWTVTKEAVVVKSKLGGFLTKLKFGCPN